MSFTRTLKKTDYLMRRWAEEPIGVAVPFFAFLAVWLPPQMPDMFAGMDAPIWKLQASARPFLFAVAAMLLMTGGAAPKLAPITDLPFETVETLIFDGLLLLQSKRLAL